MGGSGSYGGAGGYGGQRGSSFGGGEAGYGYGRGYGRGGSMGLGRMGERSGSYGSGSSGGRYERGSSWTGGEGWGGYGRDEGGRGYTGQGYTGQGYTGQGYSGQGYGDRDRDYGRGSSEDRGFIERASDEVASWFGDEDAERRRRMDERGEHRGRGPKGYARSDDRIREEICDRLTDDPMIDASEVEVTVSSGEVTLAGTVEGREIRRRAEDLAERISGVNHVQNNLRVRQSSSTMGGTQSGLSGSGTSTGELRRQGRRAVPARSSAPPVRPARPDRPAPPPGRVAAATLERVHRSPRVPKASADPDPPVG